MSSRSRARVGFRAVLVLGVAVAPVLVAAGLGDLPAPLQITVDGRAAFVRHDTTFGDVIDRDHLHATSGRLLDVEGQVLGYRADPGQILLNGASASRATPMSDGDAVQVVDGVDRTEGTRQVVTPLKGRRPGTPQFSLGTSKVEEIRVEGRISGKVVSLRYRSVGATSQPPAVALTFDDGPWPGSTRKVLEILKRMHAKATFFLIGYLAQRYPGLVRDEIKAGMTIGNHSFDHPNSPPFKDLKPHRIRTEMSQMCDLLRKRFDMRTKLFRPPGGSYDRRMIETANALRMRIVLWDVDPRDWMTSATPRQVAESVLTNVRPGSIVDLHDGGGDQSATIQALPKIIRGIRKMGLRLVAIN